jgi:DNA-binding LytR/AlgR family response regulator
MLRIAVCDDTHSFLKETQETLWQWPKRPAGMSVLLFSNPDALIETHKTNAFDIIFLDVLMPLINGIETAAEIRKLDKSVKIVFLSASREYAVDSYAVKASNYLLKPVNKAQLFACLDELISQMHGAAKSIVVKGLEATHRILLSDIEHVEAQLKHVVFFLKGNRTVESVEPFYTYENTLALDDGFFKCHRSYIVNLHFVDAYSSKELRMRSGCRISISRSCHKEFESAYFEVLFGKAGGC